MKACPLCNREYFDDYLNYCLDDGNRLTGDRIQDEPITAAMPAPPPTLPETVTHLFGSNNKVSAPAHNRKFRVAALSAISVIVLAGFGYGIYRFFNEKNEERKYRQAPALTTQRLTGDGKARGAEISPDGKFLAYIRTEGGERSIWLKQIHTNSNIQIVKPAELDRFEDLAFGPDGNFLYFNAEARADDAPSVYRVPTLGGTPTKVFENASDLQISPDGREVSFGRVDLAANETTVIVANIDGSNERRIATRGRNEFFDGNTAWSPDGTMIAAATGDDLHLPEPAIWVSVVSVADGSVRQLGSAKFTEIDDLAWHPDGESLILTASDNALSQVQLWEMSYPDGESRRLTNNLNGHRSVSITADGKSIVTGELYSRSAVWVSPDLKPENAKPVMPATSDTWGFSWTPDGRIVYISDQTGDAEVWIMDADGANAKALTSDRVFKTSPVASPDGRHIVYTNSTASGQLMRIDVNGGNPVVLYKSAGADNADISPDGVWVIFSAWVNGIQRILRVPIVGGEAQLVTDQPATEPRYSRDGRHIACFIPNETTQNWTRMAVFSSEGGPPLKVFEAPPNVNISRGPIWTPDDSGITMIVAPGELQNLWLQPIDGSEGKPMTNFGVPGVARREYSRDGKRIAIVRAEGIGNAIMITDFR